MAQEEGIVVGGPSELVGFLWSGMTCSPSKLASQEMSSAGAGVLLPCMSGQGGVPKMPCGEDFIPPNTTRSASSSQGALQGCTLPSSSWHELDS